MAPATETYCDNNDLIINDKEKLKERNRIRQEKGQILRRHYHHTSVIVMMVLLLFLGASIKCITIATVKFNTTDIFVKTEDHETTIHRRVIGESNSTTATNHHHHKKHNDYNILKFMDINHDSNNLRQSKRIQLEKEEEEMSIIINSSSSIDTRRRIFRYELEDDDMVDNNIGMDSKNDTVTIVQYDDDDEVLPLEFRRNDGGDESSAWYMLSRYVDRNSILYDTIEGFLFASCVCLIIATCYNWTYYCFWVKCCRGCCPDDRIQHRQKLLRKGIVPRRFWNQFGKLTIKLNKNSNNYYSYFTRHRRHNLEQDGKGLFTPIHILPDTYYDDDNSNKSDDAEDDISYLYSGSERHSIQRIGVPDDRSHDNDMSFNSSLSDDDDESSILSMEYGDIQLHDEYGEITNRLEDNKLVNAARNYFEKEDINQKAKQQQKIPILHKITNKLLHPNRDSNNHDNDEHYTNTSSKRQRRRRRRRKQNNNKRYSSNTNSVDGFSYTSGKSKASQKSILSSSSSSSSSNSEYTSSEGEGELEVEHAMMDLELVEQKLVQKQQNKMATFTDI